MHRILIYAAVLALTVPQPAEETPVSFPLAKSDLGRVPAGWTVVKAGKGDASAWQIVADVTTPSKSGLALAQTAESAAQIFNLCIVDGTKFKDVEVSVAFKANKGQKDQGGGIVWRYQDANNYYVARLNPLEDNFRVYKIVDGKRSPEFQNAAVKIKAGEWHTLKIRHVGEHIECFLDDKKLLDVKDDSISKAGQIGLWTKADAQTSFDAFAAKSVGK